MGINLDSPDIEPQMRAILRKILPEPAKRTIKRALRRHSAKMRSPAPGCAHVLDGVVAYNALGGYFVPRRTLHDNPAQTVLRGEVYEPDTIAFIVANARGGDIVHAGAYFGDFLPGIAPGCGSNGKIWAFEPQDDIFRCAQITVHLNRIACVELHHCGLGNESGRKLMRRALVDGEDLGGESYIVIGEPDKLDGSQLEEVVTVRLDDVIPPERHVSVIHLDVEGYEQQALAGGMDLIRRCRPIIILETDAHPGMPQYTDTRNFVGRGGGGLPALGRWVEENLAPLGYKPTEVLHHNVAYRCT